MKYFTLEWWSGDNTEDAWAPCRSYERYFASIADSLPRDLHRLGSEVSLHDARLRSFELSVSKGSLTLKLDGCGFESETKSYFDRSFRLHYHGVHSLLSTANPEAGLPGPHGYGDLGVR